VFASPAPILQYSVVGSSRLLLLLLLPLPLPPPPLSFQLLSNVCIDRTNTVEREIRARDSVLRTNMYTASKQIYVIWRFLCVLEK
jgi:hypothetical protein